MMFYCLKWPDVTGVRLVSPCHERRAGNLGERNQSIKRPLISASIYETCSDLVLSSLYPSSLWLSACVAPGCGQIQRLIGPGIKRVAGLRISIMGTRG